ncbi:MAG: ABC transporter ATP-binding protein [Phycisphaeraceae bacterium]
MSAAASQSQTVLEAQGLTKVYGSGHTEVVAVRNATLSVARGQIVALLGPSGAGKSTLLTLLGLILTPNTGRIAIGGTSVFENERTRVNVRRFRRQHLGFVFQKANLIPFLTAVENVRLAMEINDQPARASKRRAMELLEYLGVGERAHHLPSKLSGGEQQRVAVARALANRPALILADEPTAALDSVRGRQVMELFRKVAHEQNAGVIVVTHDHRALDLFDRHLEMEDGNLRETAAALAG